MTAGVGPARRAERPLRGPLRAHRSKPSQTRRRAGTSHPGPALCHAGVRTREDREERVPARPSRSWARARGKGPAGAAAVSRQAAGSRGARSRPTELGEEGKGSGPVEPDAHRRSWRRRCGAYRDRRGGGRERRAPARRLFFFFFLFPRAPSPGAIAIRGRESRKWGWVVDRGSVPGIVLDDRVGDSGIKERLGSGCRRLHGS